MGHQHKVRNFESVARIARGLFVPRQIFMHRKSDFFPPHAPTHPQQGVGFCQYVGAYAKGAFHGQVCDDCSGVNNSAFFACPLLVCLNPLRLTFRIFQGVYRCQDGREYRGGFKDGKRDGQGRQGERWDSRQLKKNHASQNNSFYSSPSKL